MQRREFVTLLGSAFATRKLAAPAQQLASLPETDFVANGKKKYLHRIIFAGFVALWLGGALFALYSDRSLLLGSLDGGYMMNLAHRQFEWHVPWFSASIDWFQGIGDIFFGVNFRLLPSFIVGSFFGNVETEKVAIYAVVLCGLSVAVTFFGLSLGASRTTSIAAAMVTCLILLPFAGTTLVYGILIFAPKIGSLVAAALLAAAAYLRFGRRGWLADLPFALIVLALLGWLVLVSVTNALLAAPFLFLCAISEIIAANNSAERRCKIGLFAAAALFLAARPRSIWPV